jgi:hypothetical protein
MNTPQQQKNEHAATTTEELIVQYLDGELHRKELESVLFGRLAQSDEARTMLHEHLVLRGAIRASAADERFTLSESLDTKTRARIEQALKFTENAPAVRTDAVTRRSQRWSLRPSVVTLALLLAIGTTWFVTRSATQTQIVTAPQVAQSQPVQAPAVQNSTVQITAAPVAPTLHQQQNVVHQAAMKKVAPEASEYAQSSATTAPKVEQKQEAPTASDLMISKRYARFLQTAEKREIVVNSKDRL